MALASARNEPDRQRAPGDPRRLRGHVSMRAILVAAVLLGAVTASGPASAQPIISSVNVDVMPDHRSKGTDILLDYLREAKKDPDLTDIRLQQQIGSPNHFILSQTMSDKAAYDRHVQADYVRKFRSDLYPHLGGPWDERLFQDMSP
jgi:quinol monooxygenase YgiN